MVKTVFLLPLHDNEGRDLSDAINTVLDEVHREFSGWTWEGRVTGSYRMADGSKKVDVCEKYMVFLAEGRLSDLETILRRFKERAQQEAIYLEIQRAVEIRLV